MKETNTTKVCHNGLSYANGIFGFVIADSVFWFKCILRCPINNKPPLVQKMVCNRRQVIICSWLSSLMHIQYIPRNMHTVFALLCFVVVKHWLIFPYPSGLLHWHCGNLKIAPVPAKQPWWIWINTSCEFIMNDCITTTKQSTTKPCAYFLGYTVYTSRSRWVKWMYQKLFALSK